MSAPSWRWVAVLLPWLCLQLGCLARVPVVRLEQRTSVQVAYVVDSDGVGEPTAAPEALRRAVEEALRARNLEPQTAAFESYGPLFAKVRDSQRRYAELARRSEGTPLLLLVEVKASFFSQLAGRYRWTVHARLSGGRLGQEGQPFADAFELPTFVDFDHQREAAALSVAAPEIADRAGRLFDGFLGEPSTTKASRADEPIYFVMVDRFANGDPANDASVDLADKAAFHGGDLKGLLARVDDLHALGVRTLWVSPVFRMRTEKFFGHGAFHGYWTYDLNALEPRFGTEQELLALSEALHRRGMKLVLDLVLNHVGPDAPLAKDKPHWFHRQGPLEDWNDPSQLVNRDVHGLPDLAPENEEVYRYLTDAALGWIDRVRPDGFRLDAVKHVPAAFWARFNQEIRQRAGKDFLLLGEMLEGDAKVLARTEREGRFGAMFDFPLYYALIDVFCRDQSPARLGAVFSQDRMYRDPDALVTLLDNHDLPRVMSDCANDPARVAQALSFQLTARGTPALTYGTESGLTGATEPDNRADMRFVPGSPLRAHVQELLSRRRGSEALRQGAPRVLAADGTLFAYARVAPSEAVLVLVNRGAQPVQFELEAALATGTRATELLGGAALSLEGRKLEAPARSVQLVRLVPSSAKGFSVLAQQAQAQWRSGTRLRPVEVQASGSPGEGELVMVGTGEELGAWNPGKAAGPLQQGRLTAALPVGAVFEYKLAVRRRDGNTEWEPGSNRALFVTDGDGPMSVTLAWAETAQAR